MIKSLAPGSKGWIKKYFELAEKNKFPVKKRTPKNLDEQYFLHLEFVKSGIVYGYPSKLIFAKDLDDASWTVDEKLKVLLFEALILIWNRGKSPILQSKEEFLKALLKFYSNHRSKGLKRYLKFMNRGSVEMLLEKILAERMHVKPSLREWIYYHSSTNMLCFIDVVLFQDFVRNDNDSALSKYPEMVETLLTAYQLGANADGIIDDGEKNLFKYLLLSSQYDTRGRKNLLKKLSSGLEISNLRLQGNTNWLYKRYILDISVLTVFFNHDEADPKELEHLNKLIIYLNLPEQELDESIIAIESFIVKNSEKVEFLKNSHSIEKIYNGLTKKWIKVLSRNKDKLAHELKESKELVYLIKKSTLGTELTKEEKSKVKSQFLDIAKGMPALAIFMLPGGALLLPLVLKIIPDLIPSAFRDNEIEEDEIPALSTEISLELPPEQISELPSSDSKNETDKDDNSKK